ncbi:MAG: AbrB/MazE/SpoVT family DNA-binding domain-containing protein, partial [bacterium]
MSKEARSVKMTRRGQLTIPKEFREELEWEEGDEFLAIPQGDDSIRVVPLGKAADALIEKMENEGEWRSSEDVFD